MGALVDRLVNVVPIVVKITMVELIVKRQIGCNSAQCDAAHEVMEGHIGYRLLAENSRRDHEEDKSGDRSNNNFNVCLQWAGSLFQFVGPSDDSIVTLLTIGAIVITRAFEGDSSAGNKAFAVTRSGIPT